MLLGHPAAIAIQGFRQSRKQSRKDLFTESIIDYSRSEVAAHPFHCARAQPSPGRDF
jgi:hypothetical protein